MEIEIIVDDRLIRGVKRLLSKRVLVILTMLLVLTGASYVYAISETPPNVFKVGDAIVPETINENFEKLFNAVFELEQNLDSAGTKGDKGDTGDAGDKGIKGDKGDPGEIGPKGLQGFQGNPGFEGDPGDPGDNGDPSMVGLTPLGTTDCPISNLGTKISIGIDSLAPFGSLQSAEIGNSISICNGKDGTSGKPGESFGAGPTGNKGSTTTTETSQTTSTVTVVVHGNGCLNGCNKSDSTTKTLSNNVKLCFLSTVDIDGHGRCESYKPTSATNRVYAYNDFNNYINHTWGGVTIGDYWVNNLQGSRATCRVSCISW